MGIALVKNHHLYDVIKNRPSTDKSYKLSQLGFYTFEVCKNADKLIIKSAVEQIFGVKVAKVNTTLRNVYSKSFRGKRNIAIAKFAYIKLSSGTISDI